MSLDQFLAEGKEHEQEQGGNDFATIAKVQVRWAYRAGIASTSVFFPYQYGDSEGKALAETQCQTKIGDERWSNGKLKRPVFGFLTEVYGNDVPTSLEGFWKTEIWSDFIEARANDKTYAKMAESLSDEIKDSVRGKMPYTAIVDTLVEINAPMKLFEEPTWCKLTQEINQWDQLKVMEGKLKPRVYKDKETFYRYFLIRHVYENEAEAKADAETIKAEQSFNQSQSANGQLSTLAHKTWGEDGLRSNDEILKYLRGEKDNILGTIENAKNGIGPDKNEKLDQGAAEDFAAEGFGISLEDFALIGVIEVPF